jgi:hypothetical protein
MDALTVRIAFSRSRSRSRCVFVNDARIVRPDASTVNARMSLKAVKKNSNSARKIVVT